MHWQGWVRWLGQRALIFVVAAVLVSSLLHIQTGLVAKQGFVLHRWAAAESSYLKGLLKGELGTLGRLGPPGYREPWPVIDLIGEQLPRSLAVLGLALVLSLVLGTYLGLLTSRFGARWLRSAILSATLVLLSAPDVLLVYFMRRAMIAYEKARGIEWLVLSPNDESILAIHLAVPVLALACLPLALIARSATVAFDEVYEQLYIRTAHAKGLGRARVIIGHALRNAWVRIAESGPAIAGALITGLVVVELILYFPGLGRTLGLILERGGQPAASSSIVLLFLAAVMGVITLFDLTRLALDPRVRAGEEPASSQDGQAPAPEAVRLFESRLSLRERWCLLRFSWSTRWVWMLRPSNLGRTLLHNWQLVAGLAGVAALILFALLGPRLAAGMDPHAAPRQLTLGGEAYFAPYRPGLLGFPLGSDMEGRSVMARLVAGARYTVYLTLAVTPIRFLFALPWGMIAGYRGGWAAWMSRVLGVTFAGVPVMVIPAAFVPLQRFQGTYTESYLIMMFLILGVVGIPRLAESIRQQTRSVLSEPFMEGARAAGAGGARLLWGHVMPHLVPGLWVKAAADMAWTLLLMAQLGLLGIYLGGSWKLGTQVMPRIPDWSAMLAKPYDLIYRAPWALLAPALAFLAAILAFNLLAEGMRRRLQAIVPGDSLPALEVLEDGQVGVPRHHWRKLAREWVTVSISAAVATGVVMGTVEVVQAVENQRNPKPAVLTVGQEMQRALDSVWGTGWGPQGSAAARRLPELMAAYMKAAHDEGYVSGNMQDDTRGLANLYDLGREREVRLLSLVIPGHRSGTGKPRGYLFIQDKVEEGRVTVVADAMKPVYATVVDPGVLIVAGTVPGPDNWVVAFWRKSADGWAPAPELAAGLAKKVPGGYGAELQKGAHSHEVAMTLGPLNSARISTKGEVEICQRTSGPCVAVPFGQ